MSGYYFCNYLKKNKKPCKNPVAQEGERCPIHSSGTKPNNQNSESIIYYRLNEIIVAIGAGYSLAQAILPVLNNLMNLLLKKEQSFLDLSTLLSQNIYQNENLQSKENIGKVVFVDENILIDNIRREFNSNDIIQQIYELDKNQLDDFIEQLEYLEMIIDDNEDDISKPIYTSS